MTNATAKPDPKPRAALRLWIKVILAIGLIYACGSILPDAFFHETRGIQDRLFQALGGTFLMGVSGFFLWKMPPLE